MGYFSIVLLVVGLFMLVRNQIVYSIRIYAIDNNYELYKKLPSYGDMIISPTQLHMWTFNQYKNKYGV